MNAAPDSESALWKMINASNLAADKIKDLTDFKNSEVNFRIAVWNPQTNGVRYLKTLIYNLCADLSPKNWERLTKIQNRNIGNPISITYDGQRVCMDYLQAVYETEFISDHLPSDELDILEIGAGYGRTCHSIISNLRVRTYTVLDLSNCLDLSRRYLKSVLKDEDFGKISFVDASDFSHLDGNRFDLCINIDSFAEMEPGVVRRYLAYTAGHCRYLYVKNPVGKYADPSLNMMPKEQEVSIAMSMGLLRDVLDIHDNSDVSSHAGNFLTVYQPDETWLLSSHSWARPWSYYWQAIYRQAAKY
jgi:putative sugar O-methyltransferase